MCTVHDMKMAQVIFQHVYYVNTARIWKVCVLYKYIYTHTKNSVMYMDLDNILENISFCGANVNKRGFHLAFKFILFNYQNFKSG